MEVNWKRVNRALEQKLGLEKAADVAALLRELTGKCGEGSSARQMLLKIGSALGSSQAVSIVVPCCPDYTHSEGKYNFRGLLGGVSLLASKHITFLRDIVPALERYKPVSVELLYADHEADDEQLQKVTGVKREDFLELVRSSVEATKAEVAGTGWQVRFMTETVPDLVEQERAICDEIMASQKYRQRIRSEAYGRFDLYWKINPRMPDEEMFRRTAATAAQYVALGRFAAEHNMLVINHSTINLLWYKQTEAAVLHNPVCVY